MHYNNICYYLLDQKLQNSNHISCIVVSCCISFLNIYMYIYKHIYKYKDTLIILPLLIYPTLPIKLNASMTISN
jgi:hypothetical protein